MITREEIKRFAPKARAEYVDALMAGTETLREAGVFETEYRLCHFLAQVGHETGGFTILRENMRHSPGSARRTWPARFKAMGDGQIKAMAKDGIAFSDYVYGGRMGNRKGTSDGFEFRGAGWIQTTGRHAFEKYAKALSLPHDDASLQRYGSDLGILLKFACLEWKESGCNEWSDENDLTKVCKAINTGSATSNIKPVGMSDRQRWFAKAWTIWGDKGDADVPNDDGMTVAQKAAVAAGGAAAVAGPEALVSLPSLATQFVADPVASAQKVTAFKASAAQLTGASLSMWILPLLIGGAVIAWLIWKEKRA